MSSRALGSGLSCRAVGPGGTTIGFRFHNGQCVAVWQNENCPYDFAELTIDRETQIASDGHNVCAFDVDEFVLAYLKKMSRSERKAVLERWSK